MFHFVNVLCHINLFADAEPSLHSWDKSHLMVVCHLLNVLLNSVR